MQCLLLARRVKSAVETADQQSGTITHHGRARTCAEVREEQVASVIEGQFGVVPRYAQVLQVHRAVRVSPHETPLRGGAQAQRQLPDRQALLCDLRTVPTHVSGTQETACRFVVQVCIQYLLEQRLLIKSHCQTVPGGIRVEQLDRD